MKIALGFCGVLLMDMCLCNGGSTIPTLSMSLVSNVKECLQFLSIKHRRFLGCTWVSCCSNTEPIKDDTCWSFRENSL